MLYPPEAFKSTDEAVVEQWSMAQLLHSEADKPVYEVLQYAGEMLVIPPGWWHAVVNTGTNMAVAENYVREFRPVEEIAAAGTMEECLQAYNDSHIWDTNPSAAPS